MEKQIIVTLGREFGSGGHIIAEKLAEKLQVELLDRESIDQILEEMGFDKEKASETDEAGKNVLFARNFSGYSHLVTDSLVQAEFDLIRKYAEQGKSFILVGRCGEELLREYSNSISVFVRADDNYKMRRIMDEYDLSSEKSMNLMRRMDRERKYYHNYYCTEKWGDARSYDVTINSGMLGLKKTVEVLENIIREKMERSKSF